MKIKKHLLKKSGFSLIEMTVALALTGILTFATVEFNKMQTRTLATVEAGFEGVDLTNLVRNVLKDEASCKASIGGKLLNNDQAVDEIVRVHPGSPNQIIAKPSVAVTKRIKVKSLKLKNVNKDKGLADLEIVIERTEKGVYGSKEIQRLIPLFFVPDATNVNVMGTCVTTGSPPADTSELCAYTEGKPMPDGTCQMKPQLSVEPPTWCPPGAEQKLEKDADGAVKIKCIPCKVIPKFDHWECNKPYSGMNWVNMCYYRSVCANDNSIVLYGPVYDGLAGPTSASGGDTGTKKNCEKKRNPCWGE